MIGFFPLLFVLADLDPNYRALRNGLPTEILRAENVELRRDKASLTLKNGQLCFIKAAQERPAIAVFTGEGVFRLKPTIPMEAAYLAKVTGKSEVEEAFDSAVLYFTDSTYTEVKSQASPMALDPHATQVLKNLRDKLHVEENVEAELLGEIYNPKRGPSFRAFLHGKKYNDLRFFMVPSGAVPAKVRC